MPEQKQLSIQDYLEMGLRRKWYILIPLMICIPVSLGVYKYLPKAYKATTVILVQPQSVPENYVHSTVTDSMAGRLNTISQEILSRTRLENVINEFNLYSEIKSKVPMETIVEKLRNSIDVKVQTDPRNDKTQNSFSVSYEGAHPETVMMVTNKLASLFIEENLKVRESQAESTAEFLSKEVQDMEQQLKEKEQNVRNFKERAMGQLPQQMDANLRTLERLQQQLQTASENMRAVEDRNMAAGIEDFGSSEESLTNQLDHLRQELARAESKYKEMHPDVMALKKKIANLELRLKEPSEKKGTSETENSSSSASLDSPTFGTRGASDEVKYLKKQINLYQRRIEDTPRREQELTLLTRDYDILRTNYQSLLERKLQAQLAENLERKQQGEQFRILDPARIPEKPIKPDRKKILLLGGLLGLAAGLGLVWFKESMDQSFHTVPDLEGYLEIPVIATIPDFKKEEKDAA